MINYKRFITIIISLSITVLLFIYLFNSSDLIKIKNTMLSLKLSHFILYAIFSLSNAFFRALRYKLLLIPAEISLKSLFGVTLIRNLFVDMFPAKLGALSYPAILNQRYKINIDLCLSSFFYSFLFDVISLPPFLLFSLIIVSEAKQVAPVSLLIIGSLVILIISGIIIAYLDKIIKLVIIVIYRLGDFFKLSKKKIYNSLRIKLEEIDKAIINLKREGSIFLIFIVSLLIRLFKYIGLFFLFTSIFYFPEAISFKHFGQLIFGFTAADFTAVLPFQFLGGYGTWETAWALIFQLFNYDKSDAATVGLSVHAYSQLWEYFIGFVAFCLIMLPFILKKK